MAKVRKNFSLPYELAQEIDNKLEDGEKSGFVARALEKQLEMDFAQDEELARRKQAIQEKLEDLQEEKAGIEKEINEAEAELNAIESALEKKEQEADLLDQATQAIAPLWREEKEGRGFTSTEDAFEKVWMSEKFGMWEEKIDASRDELKDAVKSEVEEQYPEMI